MLVGKEDLRRDRKREALLGQQVRSEGKDAYSEESDKSEDESIDDGQERVTPSEKQPEIEPDLVRSFTLHGA